MEKRVVNKKIVQKKKNMKYHGLFRGVSILLIVTTLIFAVGILRMDILTVKNALIIFTLIAVIEGGLLFVMNQRLKVGFKIPFLIVAILLSGIFSFAAYNVSFASSLVSRIVSKVAKEETYALYVLKDSTYESISDISDKTLGIFDSKSDSLEEALKALHKKATFKEEKKYDDFVLMMEDGIDKKIGAFYMTKSMEETINEGHGELFEQYRLLEEFTVKSEENVKKTDVSVTKEPFLVYISGIDTYGPIGTVSRSDVNILVAVNPNTKDILLVNTPRDYYVKLHSKKAFDKLTHAGNFGVEESIKTLEDLYSTEVDFYFKVNFSSLVKIVDTIGGITVDSKYEFSYDGFSFKKGKNRLSGAAALAFSRCRKELPMGDISRGENQEAVLKALIEKITEPSIIVKYMNILDTMSKSFVTNMTESDIYSLAKMQINDNPKWNVSVQNATGKDAYKTTYSAGKTILYVMDPDEKSVTDVKLKLNEILEED